MMVSAWPLTRKKYFVGVYLCQLITSYKIIHTQVYKIKHTSQNNRNFIMMCKNYFLIGLSMISSIFTPSQKLFKKKDDSCAFR
jgi:uncharacterized membrane protein YiaA